MDSTTSRTDRVVQEYLRDRMDDLGLTQADLQNALGGRSKGYVNDRVLGKRSWAISELDRIAPLLNLPDALSLVAAASGYVGNLRSSSPSDDADIVPASADHGLGIDAIAGMSDREKVQWIADHADEYEAVAKDIDWQAEQERYEDLP